MGLDMCLNRMPRYKNVTVKEVVALENYFEWREKKRDTEMKPQKHTDTEVERELQQNLGANAGEMLFHCTTLTVAQVVH